MDFFISLPKFYSPSHDITFGLFDEIVINNFVENEFHMYNCHSRLSRHAMEDNFACSIIDISQTNITRRKNSVNITCCGRQKTFKLTWFNAFFLRHMRMLSLLSFLKCCNKCLFLYLTVVQIRRRMRCVKTQKTSSKQLP